MALTIIAVAVLCTLIFDPAAGGLTPDAGRTSLLAPAGAADQPCGQGAVLADGVSSLGCEAASTESEDPGQTQRPPLRGYCQCSCGVRCASSADCGGAACRPFITCC